MSDDYTIRHYQPVDREGVLSLYDRRFGQTDEAWFDWRFVDNPYVDSVAIAVALHEGEVVAARPSLPVRFVAGGEPMLAILQVDAMVHPDHRRQGLFTRLVKHVYDHYASREPLVSVGFTNAAVKGALLGIHDELSLDAGVVSTFVSTYRVQHPGPLARTATDRRSLQVIAGLATPLTRAYLALTAVGTDVDESVSVAAEPLDPSVMTTLAGDPPSDGVRAMRDETFYRWRFENPRLTYTTYVGRRDGEPVAAVVTGRPAGNPRLCHLSEVCWMDRDRASLETVLRHVFEDNDDAAAIISGGSTLPADVEATAGFIPVTRPPLSFATNPTDFIVRPMTEESVDEWSHGGVDLSSPESWRMSMCEREIG